MNGIFRALSRPFGGLEGSRKGLVKTGRFVARMGLLFLVALMAGYWHNANHPMGVHLPSAQIAKESGGGRLHEPPARANERPPLSSSEQDSSESKGGLLTKVSADEFAPVSVTNETLQIRIHDDAVPEDPFACALGVFWKDIEKEVEMGHVLLIDARSASAFKAGHMPHAVSLPLADWKQHLGKLDLPTSKEQGIVVYCGNTACTTAAQLATLLLEKTKFRNIRYLYEGYWDWKVLASQATPVSELSNHE